MNSDGWTFSEEHGTKKYDRRTEHAEESVRLFQQFLCVVACGRGYYSTVDVPMQVAAELMRAAGWTVAPPVIDERTNRASEGGR